MTTQTQGVTLSEDIAQRLAEVTSGTDITTSEIANGVLALFLDEEYEALTEVNYVLSAWSKATKK